MGTLLRMKNSKLFLRNQTNKTSKKSLKFGLKSQYYPKIDLGFFRPRNILFKFDHEIRAKSF